MTRPEFGSPDDTARRLDGAPEIRNIWTAEDERNRLPHGAGIIIATAVGGLIAAIAFAVLVAL